MSSNSTTESQDHALHAAMLDWVHDVLQPFDVTSKDHEYLTDALLSNIVSPSDFESLVTSSFGSDKLHEAYAIIPNICHNDGSSTTLSASEQLASQLRYEYAWKNTDHLIALATAQQTQPWLDTQASPPQEPWRETDRLIAQAKQLQDHALGVQSSVVSLAPLEKSRNEPSTTAKKRKRARGVASHFWGNVSTDLIASQESIADSHPCIPAPPPTEKLQPKIVEALKEEDLQVAEADTTTQPNEKVPNEEPLKLNLSGRVLRGNRKSSPYFTALTPPPSAKKSPSKRPPAGTVSCMPFPPLDAPSFGLIQSKVAHEPFWLLVVVTFLIKTKGTSAAPVFWAVKERFPSPADLANPENADELKDMIQHLGLVNSRLGKLQKFGKIWMENPPAPGKVYRVRNYERRDMPLYPKASDDRLEDAPTGGMLTPKKDGKDKDAEAWEIGHMTEGKYALDSWRIFCRDVLLGRAESWNGEGAKPEFQPEWCRVRPADKELRAYLRWMWMREGFEWDPATGERTVLRPEMMRAVNEGRVEWDDTGSLRIVEELRHQEDVTPT